MKQIIELSKVAGIFTAALLLVLASGSVVRAAGVATLTSSEVVSNVTLGADLQAAATTSDTANVPQVKASRTFTVASVPVASSTMVIGSGGSLCTVTFGVGTQDIDCSNSTALINTTSDNSAILVATRLKSLTGVTVLNHGAVAVTGTTTTNVIFTTAATTETSATQITATDNAAVTTTQNINGVIPVAQVWAYLPSNVEVGDTFTAIINGTTVSFTATDSTIGNVTAGLTAAINANSTVASAVTANDQFASVGITSDVPGTAFTVTKGTTNRPPVTQVVTFTPANVDGGETFTVTINGTDYSAGTGSVQAIVEKLVQELASASGVSCIEDDAKVTCTANSTGTAFTYDTSVTQRSSHSGGGGGGGSSHHSSTSSATATAGTSASGPASSPSSSSAAASASSVSGASSFTSALALGMKGANVTLLQRLLAQDTSVYAAGTVSGYFGPLTLGAVKKFQEKYGIAKMGDAGYGTVGPRTRAKLVEVFGK